MYTGEIGDIIEFSRNLWFRYFRRPFSEIPADEIGVLGLLEKHFCSCPWNKVYEFLETVLSIEQHERLNGAMNLVLERELAGFRLLDLRFVPITDPEEVSTLNRQWATIGFALLRITFAPPSRC